MSVDYIRVSASPQLRDPALIVAFAGWNDASEVATFAARYLVDQWRARKMADIDPEEFYVFTETRPTVRVAGRFQRHIEWPDNDFYFHTNRRGKRDFVVLIGTEPQLKWRTYSEALTSFCQQQGINTVVALGGFVADVPHTAPAHLSGTGSPSWLARRLRRLGVEGTQYEGPTGIVGVLNVACARKRLATANIWGSVPEYLSASPNPKVALAMLERLRDLLDVDVDLNELRQLERQFDQQVAEVVAENPELRDYVQQLEERDRTGRLEREELPSEQEPLPSGEDLIRELEEYLRRRRSQDSDRNR